MITDKIYVDNAGGGMEKALLMAEKVAKEQKLSKKDALHLRLLTEETLGMVKAIAGEFSALLWMEGELKNVKICLCAKSDMDFNKKRGLIDVSTQKKNSAAVGIMGKIRDIIEKGIYDYDMVTAEIPPADYYVSGYVNPSSGEYMSSAIYMWSLQKYSDAMNEAESNSKYDEAEKELERSIVANIADDIRVGVEKTQVSMTIVKQFG